MCVCVHARACVCVLYVRACVRAYACVCTCTHVHKSGCKCAHVYICVFQLSPRSPYYFLTALDAGSSSDSQPQTGTTFQSALPLGLHGFSYGPRHDGGTSSTGEPAAMFSNSSVQLTRHLFPNGSSSANHIGKNPIYIEEPDLVEVVPSRPTAIIQNGIHPAHIEKNSVDLEHRVPSGSHRYSERNQPVRRGQSETLVDADHSVDLKHRVAYSCKGCLTVCIPISLVLVFCGAVALLVTFLAVPGFQRHFLTKGTSTHCRLFWL